MIRATGALMLAGALAVAAASCGGSDGNDAKDRATPAGGKTLTVGQLGIPRSLDPMLNDPGQAWYTMVAYDPLLYKRPDGKIVGQLAEKWGFVGSNNRTFDITLRPGVKFSDGTELTAEILKKSLLRLRDAGGPVSNFATYKSIDVTGPRTIRLHLSEANPIFADQLTQGVAGEAITCQKGLDDPKALTRQTCGTGPYMLDAAATVTSDHYTYVPNPHYWNKKAIRYQKIVLKVISNPEAMLNALQTGQIDFSEGDATTLPAAKGAGLKVTGTPILWAGAVLADRAGKLAPPLRDVRVRQALNYAVDRAAITKAVYRDIGQPTDQLTRPGVPGYQPLASRYPYDPAKAKQLLAAAGYPNGFTLKILSTPVANVDRMTQALGSNWEKIGVKLQIDSKEPNKYGQDLFTDKYPAQEIIVAADHPYVNGKALFTPEAPRNPFHTVDRQVESLYQQGNAAPPEQAATLYSQLEQRLVDQAWFVPVSLVNLFYYSRPTVAGAETTPAVPSVDVRQLSPAGT